MSGFSKAHPTPTVGRGNTQRTPRGEEEIKPTVFRLFTLPWCSRSRQNVDHELLRRRRASMG